MEGLQSGLDGWSENGGGFQGVPLAYIGTSSSNEFLVSRNCVSYWIFHGETLWSSKARSVLYAVCLAYCFIGIAASTATFMRAMEVMVKQTRTVKRKHATTGLEEVKEDRIWNATVADITLLAVGTSIPPIAISLIEAFENIAAMEDNGLGVGIIVGSAAFNLLATSAVCVVVPKNGTVKRFENLGVYVVELIWSIWAYIWLWIVLKFSSPDVLTLWEAVATALQFPLLILHAYAQDKQWPFISIPLEPSMWARLEHAHPENLAASYLQEESLGGGLPFDTREEGNGCSTGSCEPQGVCALWKKGFSSAIDFRGPSDKFSLVYTVRHLIMLPWNFLFALVPPVTVAHGWVTYMCAIVVIAGISELIIQLAEVIGCVTGISSYVLAVSVLAAGSAWPVLIASRISTKYATTADAAIANVNCSNSINSFVGVGIPWIIHAAYNHFALENNFRVPTVGITFSLILFFVVAVLGSAVLAVRRYYLGGEFGGHQLWAWASSGFFLALWVVFVVLSCLNFYGKL